MFKILKINVDKLFTGLFAKMLVGLTLFTIVTAILFTKGLTVLLFLIPFLIIFSSKYYNSKINTENGSNTKKYKLPVVLISLLGILCFFLFRFFQIYNPNYNIPLKPCNDYIFYSNCIDYLRQFGNENSSTNYVLSSGLNPYHYYELWLCAGLVHIFSTNTALTLVLIVVCLSNIVIWIGLCAVLEQFKVLKSLDVIFCFFLIFVTGIIFQVYTHVHFMQDIFVYAVNPVTMLKMSTNYIFIISALLFFINRKQDDAIWCLLILPVVNIGNAVSIFPAVICWYLFLYFFKKEKKIKNAFFTIILAFSILIFYKVAPIAISHVNTDFIVIFNKIKDFNYWKTVINISGGTVLQFVLIFFPYLILFLFYFKLKTVKPYLLELFLILLILSFALSAWALLNFKLTSTQLFSSIGTNMCCLISILILQFVWLKSNTSAVPKIFIVLLICIGLNNSLHNYKFGYMQSKEYLLEIKKNSKHLSENGVYIRSKYDYDFPFSYVSTLAILGHYLIYSDKQTYPLSISPYNYPYSSDKILANIERETINTTPFVIYVENQKLKGIFESIEKSQITFIEENNINYLICTKDVTLSSLLQQKFGKEIIDKNTGERFYLLK